MSTRTSKARLVAICCCCRRHATAPTHHIARSCQRLGLFVLVRASLDDSVNTKLSAGGDFDSPVKRGIFAPLERKSSAFPTAISNRRRANLWRIANCCTGITRRWAQLHARVELESVFFAGLWRARAVIFHVPKQNTDTKIQCSYISLSPVPAAGLQDRVTLKTPRV